MSTTYKVTAANGQHLGAFTNLLDVKAVVAANAGAEVKVVVDYTPCAKHAAYEAGNCPACGTAASI